MPEEMMTPKQAAAHIGVSDQTIYNWIESGVFKNVVARGITEKKRYLIPASEVERVKREGNYGLIVGNNNGLAVPA
jgi:excisionase family DNA binding protein